MEYNFKTQESSYNLKACVKTIGFDYLVAIWGGQKPHIGAVAVAQARKKGGDKRQVRWIVSVIRLTGHKEGEIARETANQLASALNATVTVTAGMHWPQITEQGITKVQKHSRILKDAILEKLKHTPYSSRKSKKHCA